MRGVERRIFGLENEYGVTCTLRGQRRLSPDEVARYLFRRVVSWGRSQQRVPRERRPALPRRRQPPRVRHPRVRLDPRPRRPRQGRRAHPRAAARRGRAAAPRGGHPRRHLPVQEQHRLGRQLLRLPRELPRRAGATTSATSPTCSSRSSSPARSTPAPARCCRPPGARCTASPSGPSTSGRACRRATTRSRPIINTRDEPHADAERFRRLHVIVGDSNMSEYTTFLKVGRDRRSCCACSRTPAVVLRDMTLENPIRAIREISHDMTCRRRVRLANGREVSRPRDPGRVPRTGRCASPRRQGLSPLEQQALDDVGARA